jgi:hypothetical protein
MRLVSCVKLYHAENTTYTSATLGMWAFPEIFMGFIAACVPILPRFFREHRLAASWMSWLFPTSLGGFSSAPSHGAAGRSWPGGPPLTSTSASREGGNGKPRGAVAMADDDEEKSVSGPIRPREWEDTRRAYPSMPSSTRTPPPRLPSPAGITKTVDISTGASQRMSLAERTWYHPNGFGDSDIEQDTP